MKPFTADETSINCKSENNSFNDNSEIFTADDYVCIRITNHREDEEYVFGNFSKDTSDEEVKRYIDQFHQYLDQYSKQSPYQISVAAGYALRKDLSITVQDMYMQADSQMYMNKYQMKNKSC